MEESICGMYFCRRNYSEDGKTTKGNVIMSVPSPIAQADALELAKEHYAFTPDRVDQGTSSNTLSEVAECLKVSKIWYFWWD